MSDHSSTPKPAAPQSTLMLVAIGLLVVIALMMFLNLSQQDTTTPANTQDDERLEALRKSVAQKELELKAKGIALPVDSGSIDALSQRISKDANELRKNIGDFQSLLTTKEDALSKAKMNLQAALTTNQQLSAESAQLRESITALQSQKSATNQLAQQLASLKAQLENKTKQIAELSTRPTLDTVNQFRESLNQTRLTNESLTKKIAALETQLSKAADSSELSSLQAQLQKLRPENEALKLELQRLRADNDFDTLFAKSAADLNPEAMQLHAALAKLEGLTPELLTQAYAEISTQYGAHMVRKVRFSTGSSAINWQDVVTITDSVESANSDSFFLVVGYASKTGNVESNKVLSAKRSVTIASTVKQLKGSDNTRAVFLGQTERFSPEATENQICEIWELRK